MIFPHLNGSLVVRHTLTTAGPREATATSNVKSEIPAALPAQSLLLEGEDANLNGMTRSLQRRLLGLNLAPAEAKSQEVRVPLAA